MLYQVNGFRSGKTGGYCGPSAACLITGIKYTEATAVMREISGERLIKGVSTSLMMRTMVALGWTMCRVEFDSRGTRTLARWLRERKPEQLQATFILIVGRSNFHYVVVQGRKGGDSFSRGPVWLSEMKWRRRPVTQVFEVRKTDAAAAGLVAVRLANEAATKHRTQSSAARTRRKWRKETEVHALRLELNLRFEVRNSDDDIIYELPGDKWYQCGQSIWFENWEEAAHKLAGIAPSDFEDYDDIADAA